MQSWLPVLLGGVIGLATNWIAILMLFRPHRPKPWLPFWRQGLVPRERAALALQIGAVVGEELLGPDRIQAMLEGEEGRRRSKALLDLILEAAAGELARRPLGELLHAEAWERWAQALGDSLHDAQTRERIRQTLASFLESSLARAGQAPLGEALGESTLKEIEGRLGERLLHSDWGRKAESLLSKGKWIFTPAFVADWLAKKQGRSTMETASRELAHLLVESLAERSLLQWLDLEGEERRSALAAELSDALLERALGEEALKGVARWAREALGPLLEGEVDALWGELPPSTLEQLRALLEERLHEALAGNAAAILRGADVPDLVRQRIDGYPIAELEGMVMDVSGRHLGWITLWGGVLGAMLGGIQVLLAGL